MALFDLTPPPKDASRLKNYADYLAAVKSIDRSFARHHMLLTEGGLDPMWPDGVNANLVRNHIIHDQGRAKAYAEKCALRPPDIVFRPLPEEVSSDFEAPGSIRSGRAQKRPPWSL